MGEARREALRVDFDSQIKLEFHGAAITSDAGLVAYRELDEVLGLTATADDMFRDPRHGKNTQHELTGLLRKTSPKRDRCNGKVLYDGRMRLGGAAGRGHPGNLG